MSNEQIETRLAELEAEHRANVEAAIKNLITEHRLTPAEAPAAFRRALADGTYLEELRRREVLPQHVWDEATGVKPALLPQSPNTVVETVDGHRIVRCKPPVAKLPGAPVCESISAPFHASGAMPGECERRAALRRAAILRRRSHA